MKRLSLQRVSSLSLVVIKRKLLVEFLMMVTKKACIRW